MELFFEFLTEQWLYVGALLVCITLLMQHESRKGGGLLSPQELVNKVNQDKAVVLDVRDGLDYDKGHIVDAINIPYAKLQGRMAELESYRNKPLILVCKMGQHSGSAGKALGKEGFEQVFRLRGGMMEWENSQLPLIN